LWSVIVERASASLQIGAWTGGWHSSTQDPILGNSALDRLANAVHQIVIEGPSYRVKLAPKHRIGDNGVLREEVIPIS
jgi:hypothetical protein